MVLLRSPAGVPYCIDQHEVRQKDYAPFVQAAASDPASIKKLACGEGVKWTLLQEEYHQTTGESYVGCGEPGTWDPEKHGDWPKTCVGECAAKAFCTFVGKELCGAVGGGPLALDKDGYVELDPERNAWFNACSNGGKTLLPSGDEKNAPACAPSKSSSAVQSEPLECRSGDPAFAGLVGLGTGVKEYINACMGPNGTTCAVIGPSFYPFYEPDSYKPPRYNECGEAAISSSGSATIGFRCCKPLPLVQPGPRRGSA